MKDQCNQLLEITMKTRSSITLAASLLLIDLLACGSSAHAADAGVKVGVLTCNVAKGWGFIFESTHDLNCSYSPNAGTPTHYTGHIAKYGVDIGYTKEGLLVWGVLAPTRDLAPGSLAGDYGGVTGGASVGVGASANVLIGGSNKTISLQPLSIEGYEGLNVAAGIASITLKYQQ
jgi:hypothetical protein